MVSLHLVKNKNINFMNSDTLKNLIIRKLSKEFEKSRTQWHKNEKIKTKYFCIDNLLPDNIINDLYSDFLNSKIEWNRQISFREKKYNFAKIDYLNNLIPTVTDIFHDQEILNIIENITSIKRLDADPKLYAGGISKMIEKDFLNPHIDNSHDSKRLRYRRLNLLFYVSPNWNEEKGGNLLLWDSKVKNYLKIISRYNRLVIMETNSSSWHSVDPLRTNMPRFCLSNYYFSKNSPTKKNYYHVTSFSARPEQKFLRFYSLLDNFMRQQFSKFSGLSRGKNLTRFD